MASEHIRYFDKYSENKERESARLFEFGAGWDLIIPIAFFTFGIQKQVVIDNRANARLELINDTISKIQSHRSSIEAFCDMNMEVNTRDMNRVRNTDDLQQEYGIIWLAPLDARSTGLPSNEFHFISNTLTLEHIPTDAIPDVFNECYRLLQPDGIMSCLIDLKDHYASFDSKISIYNYLRYSDGIWRIMNSGIHYQNRLRYPDYQDIIENKTGFRILQIEKEEPGGEDLKMLEKMKLDDRFRRKYPIVDLGAKTVWFVLKKQ